MPVLSPIDCRKKTYLKCFMWTRFYVLFSVNLIIFRELVPFEKWYQEANDNDQGYLHRMRKIAGKVTDIDFFLRKSTLPTGNGSFRP